MRTWVEYSADIETYYEWICKQNNEIFKEMRVLSFNTRDFAAHADEFFQYCLTEISRTLKCPEAYHLYMIINEEVRHRDSKVEHYKKCWKKIAPEFDISRLELGEEFGYEYNGRFFYAGIAKTAIANMVDVMRIAKVKSNKCVVFASKENYFARLYMNREFVESYIAYNQYGDIDYSKCFLQCCLNHDLGIRYGTDFSNAELALVFSSHDCDTILNFEIIKPALQNNNSQIESDD